MLISRFGLRTSCSLKNATKSQGGYSWLVESSCATVTKSLKEALHMGQSTNNLKKQTLFGGGGSSTRHGVCVQC